MSFLSPIRQKTIKRLQPAVICMLCVLLASPAFGRSMTPDAREIHVLDRLGFGPRPGDIERVKTVGVENFLREQLSPITISYPDSLQSKLDNLETLRKSAPQLFLEYGPPSYADMKGDREAAQRARQRARVIVDEAIDARLLRAIESPRQLEEVMVNFWFNHFNVFSQKGLDRLWVGSYEEEAIRPFVLGRFRDLLGATAIASSTPWTRNLQGKLINVILTRKPMPRRSPLSLSHTYKTHTVRR